MNSIVIAIIGAIFVLFLVLSYNRMKKLDVNVDNSFADLDAFLMKRVDQLDNLIQTARVATDKEIEMLENISGLRMGIVGAHGMDEKMKAHVNLERELPAFFRTMEAYPEVKFNENYLHIQRSINEIEEQIQAARRNFNSHTAKYNKSIAVFPQSMIAGVFRFSKKAMFETPPEKRENTDVKALFNR